MASDVHLSEKPIRAETRPFVNSHLRLHTKDDTNKNVLIFVLTDNCKIIQHMSKRWMMKKLFVFSLPRYSK